MRLLYCREILDSAVKALAEQPPRDRAQSGRREVPEESDETGYGAD